MRWLAPVWPLLCLCHGSWAFMHAPGEDTESMLWTSDLDSEWFDRLTMELSMSASFSYNTPTPSPGASELDEVPPTPAPQTATPTELNSDTMISPTVAPSRSTRIPPPTASPSHAPETMIPTVVTTAVAPTTSPTSAIPDETMPPTFPTTAPIDDFIMSKCGFTAEERSTLLLTVLSSISNNSLLMDPSSSQYAARDWLDNVDGAVICPLDVNRVLQRYTAALIYFQLGGPNWSNCQADLPSTVSLGVCVDTSLEDVANDTSSMLPDSTRFLEASNECNWFGLTCKEASETLSADELSPITHIELPSNGLAGDLPLELFGITSLKSLILDGNKGISGPIPHQISQLVLLEYLDLDDNIMTDTLPEEIFGLTSLLALDLNNNSFTGPLSPDIGNLVNLRVLQLQNNQFRGPLPTESLLLVEGLVSLHVDGNDFTGSFNTVCEVLDERREDFNLYLRFLSADCGEVECWCCQCFP